VSESWGEVRRPVGVMPVVEWGLCSVPWSNLPQVLDPIMETYISTIRFGFSRYIEFIVMKITVASNLYYYRIWGFQGAGCKEWRPLWCSTSVGVVKADVSAECFNSKFPLISDSGRWIKSRRNPVVLSVIHHHLNPSDSTLTNYMFKQATMKVLIN
jgi:hypothetical protein